MSGRYQLLAAVQGRTFLSFGEAQRAAGDFDGIADAAAALDSRVDFLIRDLATGGIYDLRLDDVPDPDSRRVDLVNHAKDTLLWPYRGLGDE